MNSVNLKLKSQHQYFTQFMRLKIQISTVTLILLDMARTSKTFTLVETEFRKLLYSNSKKRDKFIYYKYPNNVSTCHLIPDLHPNKHTALEYDFGKIVPLLL